jgi:outer membrane protein assembly factor BamB
MIKPFVLAAGTLLGVASSFSDETHPPYAPLEEKARLIWKTKIGIASFRSNVLFLGNRLHIGSNGEDFMDRGLIESSSGVYAIDRKKGKQLVHFAHERYGDMDVNGLLLHNNRLFFGNDNEEFLCTDLQGNIQWRNPTSGDIEHEPVLIKSSVGASVVYAAESGEVKAVDSQNGNIRWSYYVPDFNGWKPGDNRSLFKIKAWFSNTGEFYTKPLLQDINKDGVTDLIYLLYSGQLLTLNGNNGKELWRTNEENNLSLSVALVGNANEKMIVGFRNVYTEGYHRSQECVFLSLQGNVIKTIKLDETFGGSGLNLLSLPDGTVLLNGRTKTYQIGVQGIVKVIDRKQVYMATRWDNKKEEEFRNGYDPLFANRTISLPGGKTGVVIMNQRDHANSEMGFLEILSLEDGGVIDRLSIPSISEMPPVIQDVDLDGNLDILISGYDGYLYCYQLPKY